jgi:hypothetical protein
MDDVKPFYAATVLEVQSADDITILLDFGVGGSMLKKRARLAGVDAPDAYKKGPDTTEGKLREEVRQLLRGADVLVRVDSETKTSLRITLVYKVKGQHTPINLNSLLIERGFIFKRR